MDVKFDFIKNTQEKLGILWSGKSGQYYQVSGLNRRRTQSKKLSARIRKVCPWWFYLLKDDFQLSTNLPFY